MREALFLWMRLCFAARSAREEASFTSFSFLLLCAVLKAISSRLLRVLFTFSFRLEPLRALLAVLVTGILLVHEYSR